MTTKKYALENFSEIESVRCPCGQSRRAFAALEGAPATVHCVEISADARTHYHKKLTEIYVILEAGADACMELDGALIPVKAFSTILIKPGCRHRAVGKMKVINTSIPAFDPDDEWFD